MGLLERVAYCGGMLSDVAVGILVVSLTAAGIFLVAKTMEDR